MPIHTETLLSVNARFASFWLIVHMDHVNAVSENALFWNWVSGWEKPKAQPSCFCVDSESTYFPFRWRHHPTPWPLAFDLWTPQRLITTTTTMADYCLCSCFLQLTRLVVEYESQQQFNFIIGPHKRFWFPCSGHFLSSSCCVWFLLLLSVCLSVHKLYAHALSLLLRFWLISSATYRPGIWTTAFWVIFSWYSVANVLEITQRKTEEKDHFGTCGQGQRMNVASLYTVTNTVKNCSTITSCYGKFGCSYLVNCSSVINSIICFNENDLVNLLCFPLFKGGALRWSNVNRIIIFIIINNYPRLIVIDS